jgi:hypothetical protein
VRDIGDRDDEAPAAAVERIGIGLGPHRVIEIARITAVDRNQRQCAQIDTSGEVGRLCRRGLGQRRRGKLGWDSELGNGEAADRAGGIGCTEALDNPQPWGTVAPRRKQLGADQFAIGGATSVRRVDEILVAVAAIGRRDTPAIGGAVKDPDDPV